MYSFPPLQRSCEIYGWSRPKCEANLGVPEFKPEGPSGSNFKTSKYTRAFTDSFTP